MFSMIFCSFWPFGSKSSRRILSFSIFRLLLTMRFNIEDGLTFDRIVNSKRRIEKQNITYKPTKLLSTFSKLSTIEQKKTTTKSFQMHVEGLVHKI
jgi:hypothetical protein